MKRIFLIMLLMAVYSGTVTPSHAREDLPLEDDENRLWLRAEEEEKSLDTSGLIYRDKKLDAYIDVVVRKLIPPELLARVPISVTVIKNPYYNAFTFPNGRIYLHSGILAAMENEAQLATLLGHESSHAIGRHMLKEMRDAKDKTAFSATLGALTGNVILPFSNLGALAAISGYSRELETEADMEGLRLLVQAGYDPAEAPKLFAILQKDARDETQKESFFFSSHPKLQERLDNYNKLLKSKYAEKQGGVTNAGTFLQAVSPLLLDNAELGLRAGRIAIARQCVERYLAVAGDNARAYLILGETYRQSGQKEDIAKAKEYYLKAATLDPSYPDPHHFLGLVAYKLNDRELARKSLERYLVLFPQAPDRGYIEEMLKSLR